MAHARFTALLARIAPSSHEAQRLSAPPCKLPASNCILWAAATPAHAFHCAHKPFSVVCVLPEDILWPDYNGESVKRARAMHISGVCYMEMTDRQQASALHASPNKGDGDTK